MDDDGAFEDHDQPTRIGSTPWSDPTRDSDERPTDVPSYWRAEQYPTQPAAPNSSRPSMSRPSTSNSGPPNSSSSRPRTPWLVVALAAACVGLALVVAWLVVRPKGDDTKATPSSMTSAPSSTRSAVPGAASAPTSDTEAQATSAGAPSSTSSSPAVVAPFPADAVSSCGGGAGHSNETVHPLDDDTRVTSSNGGAPSCAFVADTREHVVSRVQEDPTTAGFAITVTSDRDQRPTYTLQCGRADALTRCTVPNSTFFTTIYVRG